MRYIWILAFLGLWGCGPSQKEIDEVSTITCNIMAESRNMDAAQRVREINNAREKLGMDAYLGRDSQIKESFEWGLCTTLVADDDYDEKLLLLQTFGYEWLNTDFKPAKMKVSGTAPIRGTFSFPGTAIISFQHTCLPAGMIGAQLKTRVTFDYKSFDLGYAGNKSKEGGYCTSWLFSDDSSDAYFLEDLAEKLGGEENNALPYATINLSYGNFSKQLDSELPIPE